MSATSRRWFVVAATAAAQGAWARSSGRCTICDRLLPMKYVTYEGKPCCSELCARKLKPKCAQCHSAIEGRYYELEGKTYCSERCFDATLPKCEICSDPIKSGYIISRHNYCEACYTKSPNCFSCGLPAAYPEKLVDGRVTCAHCARWAVKDQNNAEANYEKARQFLESWTHLKIQSVPKLSLVGRSEMNTKSSDLRKTDNLITIRGLYSRQTYMRKRGFFGAWKESPEDATETIYIVDHLHDAIFRIAAVHELMHDLIHEHFKRIEKAPLWVHEGICQVAAAEYCNRRNYADALELLEACEDPDYGDGYRYMKSVAGFQGWAALRHWMETVEIDTLPKAAPKN